MERDRYYLGLLVKIKQVMKRSLKLKPSGRKSLDIQNHFSYCVLGCFIFYQIFMRHLDFCPPWIHVGDCGSLWFFYVCQCVCSGWKQFFGFHQNMPETVWFVGTALPASGSRWQSIQATASVADKTTDMVWKQWMKVGRNKWLTSEHVWKAYWQNPAMENDNKKYDDTNLGAKAEFSGW